MVAAAMKHMALNFAKIDKFEGVDFRRWQKKMHFLLSCMSVMYVLTTPILEDGENAIVDQIRRRQKWDNDDYVSRGLILKGMAGPLFEIYQNVESGKELWDSLEARYMAEDAIMEQYNELLGILGRFTQHKMNMDEAIHVSCIINKPPHSWKDFKHTLKHNKEELTLVELGNHMRIKESLRALDSDKPKGNNVAVVRLPGLKLKFLGERGIECIFVGYAEHSKAFRLFVILPNESVSINSIIESRDAIFDENRLSSVARPSLSIPKGTEDIVGLVVPEKVTKEVIQQPKPKLRKSKRNKTPKDFEPEFQLYLIEGTRDEVSDQHSYCFNVKDDLETFDKAMKSQDVAFRKEAINDEMDSITGNNTWVLADLPLVDKCVYSKFDESGKGVIFCLYVDDMLIFGTDQV
ncbi:hypothetical protein Tco_1023028 [Tanacetum coccineum]